MVNNGQEEAPQRWLMLLLQLCTVVGDNISCCSFCLTKQQRYRRSTEGQASYRLVSSSDSVTENPEAEEAEAEEQEQERQWWPQAHSSPRS
jgi:hypothetical protein